MLSAIARLWRPFSYQPKRLRAISIDFSASVRWNVPEMAKIELDP